jgi:cyclic pyranopterin phosphate synthase
LAVVITAKLRAAIRPYVRTHPGLKRILTGVRRELTLVKHSTASILPVLIQPKPTLLQIAITAHCNFRCDGCRYGRDFMLGQQLPLETVKEVLAEAAQGGILTVRLYGGEPLIHPDLAAMIRHCIVVGIQPVITTNGYLLDRKIDSLYQAGLRAITIGYYGHEKAYDRYVHVEDAYTRLERSIAFVRRQYGDGVTLQINFVLMKPTCSIEALRKAWDLARKYQLLFQVDLVHYSLPYFSEGPNRELQFRPEDEPALRAVVAELLKLREEAPSLYLESSESIRSIPDWLLLGPQMNVPCDAYNLLWIGADGTVQLCYAAFPLGNVRRQRLRDILFSDAHRAAAQAAFQLACPHCHCGRMDRIDSHLPSRIKYAG